MKVITYLGFTFLSILIQFCVMDFIQEKIQTEDTTNLDVTTKKEILNDLLKNISSKPHALYYRTHVMTRSLTNMPPSKVYNNSSMPEVTLATTDGTTTVFDVLYDENTSDTEATPTSTEMYYTSTQFDNLTEITFFETKNKSSMVPSTTPKINYNMHCDCNLLVSKHLEYYLELDVRAILIVCMCFTFLCRTLTSINISFPVQNM